MLNGWILYIRFKLQFKLQFPNVMSLMFGSVQAHSYDAFWKSCWSFALSHSRSVLNCWYCDSIWSRRGVFVVCRDFWAACNWFVNKNRKINTIFGWRIASSFHSIIGYGTYTCIKSNNWWISNAIKSMPMRWTFFFVSLASVTCRRIIIIHRSENVLKLLWSFGDAKWRQSEAIGRKKWWNKSEFLFHLPFSANTNDTFPNIYIQFCQLMKYVSFYRWLAGPWCANLIDSDLFCIKIKPKCRL